MNGIVIGLITAIAIGLLIVLIVLMWNHHRRQIKMEELRRSEERTPQMGRQRMDELHSREIEEEKEEGTSLAVVFSGREAAEEREARISEIEMENRRRSEERTSQMEMERRRMDLKVGQRVPSSERMDAVNFSITGPATAASGSTVELQFWANDSSQGEEVIKRARVIIGVDLMHRSEGPFEVERGAKLSVRVTIRGIDISPKHKVVQWLGVIGIASFVATVPKDSEVGPHAGVVSIRLNGAQFARLDFLFTVGERTAQPGPIPGQVSLHKNAFASYANEDRDQVIARVQGMEMALKSLKVFVDVVTLRAGEYWEGELQKHISNADVFYLFWCRHAKESKWVDMEWRFALRERGLDFIDPVPLEPPAFAEPPTELASKHFNGPLLPYMAAHAKQIGI